MTTFMYILLGIYCFFLIGLSFFYGRRSPDEVFLIAGRDRPASHILASKFSASIGVGALVTYTSYAYSYSLQGILPLISGMTLGYLVFALWAVPKIRQFSMGQSFYTQGDLVRFITVNEQARRLTDVVTIVIQFFWVLLGLVTSARVFDAFGLLSYENALLFASSITLSYLWLSGLKAVIVTDMVQTFLVSVLLPVVVLGLLWNGERSVSDLLHTTAPHTVTLQHILGLALYGGFSVFGLADRYQLCYAARHEQAARRGMAWVLLPIIGVVFLLLLIGLEALAQTPNLSTDLAFTETLTHLLSERWHPLLLLLFFAGLMGSIDTSIFAVASHTAFLFSPTHTNAVQRVRNLMVVTVVLATVVAYCWQDIVELTLIGAALRMTLALPMIYIISRGNNTGRFIMTTLLGLLGLGIGLIIFGVQPPIILTTLLGSGLGLMYKSPHDERFWK